MSNESINNEAWFDNIESFVKEFYLNNISNKYYYHSFRHTKEVVASALVIAKVYDLSKEEKRLIQIAAWFHDLGYENGHKNHEERGVELMRAYLKEHISEEALSIVANAILGTNMSLKPEGLIAQIIRDADSSHLGSKVYFDRVSVLRAEWLEIDNKSYEDEEWYAMNIEFLEKHEYYTPVAKSLFDSRKIKNIQKLKELLEELENPDLENVNSKKGRGVETLFRTTLRNHNSLSQIADNKANIMLSISAIMLSLVLSSLSPKIDSNPRLLWPLIIIVAVCLLTMFFAILATIPQITKGEFNEEEFLKKKINILFFGNFYKMKLEKFEWGIQKMMEDDDLLYRSLTKDLYFLGIVLAKKYAFLRTCYMVFMSGLVIAALSFIAVLM
jgi:predicted metal-dependent HD superfamily phosphohydrolase